MGEEGRGGSLNNALDRTIILPQPASELCLNVLAKWYQTILNIIDKVNTLYGVTTSDFDHYNYLVQK